MPAASAAVDNAGLRLGAALGELALAGRDKVTFITSHSLATFPEWIEQLIAESTGKTILAGGERRGIVPVAGEPLGTPDAYGDDRFFAALLLQGDDISEIEKRLEDLEGAGHPVGRFKLSDRYDLGAEMFRWEVATAAAGSILARTRSTSPTVQLAKTLANEAMKQAAAGKLKTGGGATDAADAGALGSGRGRLAGGCQGGRLPGHPRLPAAAAGDHGGGSPGSRRTCMRRRSSP